MATFVPYTTLFRSRTSTGQEKIMSADKHKNLAIRAGYLRASSSEGGLGLNIKWARKLTPFLIGMIKDGEIVLHRTNGPGKNVTSAHITPVGAARLDAILKRFGPDFGPISSKIGSAHSCASRMPSSD